MTKEEHSYVRPPAFLRRALLQTHVVLLAEHLYLAFWPLISLGIAGLAALAWRLPAVLTGWMGLLALLLYGLGLFWALIRGLRRFQRPVPVEVYNRLDQMMSGRPVGNYFDTLALGKEDEATRDLWRAHQLRYLNALNALRIPRYHVRLAGQDPYALRLWPIIALLMGLFSPFILDQEVTRGNTIAQTPSISGPRYELWAQPPSYTSHPNLYLSGLEKTEPFIIPEHSEILLRSYDSQNTITLSETVSATGGIAIPPFEQGFAELRFAIRKSGQISIVDPVGENSVWAFDVIPDLPPEVVQTSVLKRTVTGAMDLRFAASDDYGIRGGHLDITLDLDRVVRRYGLSLSPEEHAPPKVELKLPFVNDLRAFEGQFDADLSKHPWAGLPVRVKITVYDDIGHIAHSEESLEILSYKRFFDPVAKAVVDLRQQLLWNRENVTRVHQLLRAMTHQPQDVFEQYRPYLLLRSAVRRLDYRDGTQPLSDEMQSELAGLLWRVAQLLEDGDVSTALERLRRAQERLSEAIRNGANNTEIAQLMQELRDATQAYMNALARNSKSKGNQQAQQQQSQSQTISTDKLQELFDRLQTLMEQGRMAEADEVLKQIQQILENLTISQGSGSGQSPSPSPSQSQSSGGKQGQSDSAGESLQDLLQKQQDLADETFQELQREFDQSGNQGNAGRRGDLARRQGELQQELQNQTGKGTAENQQALRGSQNAMRGAEQSIRNDDLGQALEQQSQALDQLREGLRGADQSEQRRAEQSGKDGKAGKDGKSGDGDSDQPSSGLDKVIDPLGRPAGRANNGNRFGDDRNSNEGLERESDFLRYDELFKELHKRSQDRTRPEYELDYLDRLLDRF